MNFALQNYSARPSWQCKAKALLRQHCCLFSFASLAAFSINAVAQEPPTRTKPPSVISAGAADAVAPGQNRSSEPPVRPRTNSPLPETAGGVLALVDVSDQQPEPDSKDGQPILVIDNAGFLGAVEAVDFSPDAKLVAAAGEYQVRIWEVSTGKLVATLRGDRSKSGRGEVVTVKFSPDGAHLLVGVNEYSDTGSIRVYRTDRWDEIEQVLPVKNVGTRKLAFSQDGRTLVSSNANGELILWDWKQRRQLSVKPRRNATATIFDAVEFFGAEPALITIELDGYFVYDLPSFRQLDASNAPQSITRWMMQSVTQDRQFKYPYASQPPRMLSFRLDRNRWAAAGSTSSAGAPKHWVAVWKTDSNPNDRAISNALPVDPMVVYSGHRWTPTAVTLSGDAKLVASGDKFGQVHVWEAETGRVLHKFEGEGAALYAGHFSSDRAQIGFTQKPDYAQWRLNHYGQVTHVLDLKRRTIQELKLDQPERSINDVTWREMSQRDQQSSLRRQLAGGTYSVVREENGRLAAAYDLPTGIEPTIFSLLDGPAMGINHPVIIGTKQGGLMAWDASGNELRRYFLGHVDMLTATSQSNDGKLLLSSATDRTLRIWSLVDAPRPGIPDFKYEDSRVKQLDPQSASYRAGIRVGDVIQKIDNFGISDFYDAVLDGRFVKQAGDTVSVSLANGRQYSITLVPGFEIVEPLLSVFIASDDSWIIWDQRGYYDCSPGADRLIGWHVGNGRDREASFYRAQQFQQKFYRPDIIDRLIETGETPPRINEPHVDSGSSDASTARLLTSKTSNRTEPDLRRLETLKSLAPPVAKIVSPDPGVTLSDNRVTIEIELRRNGDAAISRVYFLNNGHRADEIRLTADESSQQSLRLQQRMTLGPGRNRISVIAENVAGIRSDSDACQLTLMAPVTDRPTAAYVLSIGVSEYQLDGQGISNLRYPAKDAIAFSEMLHAHNPDRLYRKVHSRVLANEQATRAGIIEGLEWLIESAQPDDVVFLFVAAHGQVDSRGQFYLMAHDTDPAKKATTGVLFEQEINNRLVSQLPNCRRIVLLDTCHSGAALEKESSNFLVPLSSPHLGLVIYSSSDSREESFESDSWGHGAFTLSLLEAVKDESVDSNGNAFLDTVELKVAIRKKVPILTNRRQNPRVILPPDDLENDLLEMQTALGNLP